MCDINIDDWEVKEALISLIGSVMQHKNNNDEQEADGSAAFWVFFVLFFK